MITTQQSVFQPDVGYPGDPYNTAVINQGLVQAGTVINGGVKIGTFCWGVSGSRNVTQLKSDAAKVQLAGLVIRSQNTPIDWANVQAGYSYIIGNGYQANFVSKGTFLVDVISLNPAGVINPNDIVYIRLADGATCVATADPGAAYFNTGWMVTKVDPGPVNYPLSGSLVVISNEQTFN